VQVSHLLLLITKQLHYFYANQARITFMLPGSLPPSLAAPIFRIIKCDGDLEQRVAKM